MHEFEATASRYLAFLRSFLEESDTVSMTVSEVETNATTATLPAWLVDGAEVDLSKALAVCELELREQVWCRLDARATYIHFAFDLYVYGGSTHECPTAMAKAHRTGLFIESGLVSPLLRGR